MFGFEDGPCYPEGMVRWSKKSSNETMTRASIKVEADLSTTRFRLWIFRKSFFLRNYVGSRPFLFFLEGMHLKIRSIIFFSFNLSSKYRSRALLRKRFTFLARKCWDGSKFEKKLNSGQKWFEFCAISSFTSHIYFEVNIEKNELFEFWAIAKSDAYHKLARVIVSFCNFLSLLTIPPVI